MVLMQNQSSILCGENGANTLRAESEKRLSYLVAQCVWKNKCNKK